MKKIESNNYENGSKELLMKLSKEIADNFSISQKLAEKYISSETIKSLDDLKEDLIDNNEQLAKIDIKKLYDSIENKKEKINIFVKNEIKKLKDILPDKKDVLLDIRDLNVDNEILRRIFSKKLIDKAKDPKNISEQILGASLGLTNSVIYMTQTTYDIGIGIIKSVPDLIYVFKGKGEIDSLKKV